MLSRTCYGVALAGMLLPAMLWAQSPPQPGDPPPDGPGPRGGAGGGAFPGGPMGPQAGFGRMANPAEVFNMFSGGKDVWERDDKNPQTFDRLAERFGVKGTKITREEFNKFTRERMAFAGGQGGAGDSGQGQPMPGGGGRGGSFGSGGSGGGMAGPGPAGRDREIEELRRRIEALESRTQPFGPQRPGPGPGTGGAGTFPQGPPAGGPPGLPGGMGGAGFPPGMGTAGFAGGMGTAGFGGGFSTSSSAGSSSRSSSIGRTGPDGLARLTEQIAAKRRELQGLEEQYRTQVAEMKKQQSTEASLEQKLDRLLKEVEDIRQEIRRDRGGRTPSPRGRSGGQ